MARIKRAVLSYDEISRRAEAVLAEHHEIGTLPIPIEELVEFRFGIELQVGACLRDSCEVEALISHDCKTVYVDAHAYLAPSMQARLRFSLAHELAHCILHKEVFASLPFKTMAEWKAVYHAIQGDDLWWVEYQANSFAGLLLVPRSKLKQEWGLAKQKVIADAKKDQEYAEAWTIDELTKRFAVSEDVMRIRCQKDGLIQ